MTMSSASAVISDCDGVPGQQSRSTLCKQPLRGTHSHPGQWKSELQHFLLKYSEIPGNSCVCKACERSIRRGKYKGLNKTSKRKSNCCAPGCGKTSNVYSSVLADFDSVSEEEVSTPLRLRSSIIMPPTHTADVLLCTLW